MIRNFSEKKTRGSLPRYDLCIVGSGPAGLAVWSELEEAGLRIAVLESGGLEKSDFADGLRKVAVSGLALDPDCQERMLGGTSETWAGLCAPLDPIDFEPRPWPHHLGWPISRADLEPYYRRAAARYGFPASPAFDEFKHAGAAGGQGLLGATCEGKVFLKPSPIFRFGSEFRGKLAQSGRTDLLINATVTRLETNGKAAAGRAAISAAVCKAPDGSEARVCADVFVLATGGIESARLLLASTDACPAGLGNEHQHVGRYLMNHPKGRSGVVRLRRPIELSKCFAWENYEGGIGYVGHRLAEARQREQGRLNSYVTFSAHYPWSNRDEPEAFRAVLAEVKGFLPRFARRSRDGYRAASRRYLKDLKSLQGRWTPLLGALWHALRCSPIVAWLLVRRLVHRRAAQVDAISFMNYAEMAPDPENRVVLGTERDALGMPVAEVRHRLQPRDLDSMLALQQSIVAELERQGYVGVLEGNVTSLAAEVTTDACHYLGTARMGTDPTTSVVDADLRVHSVANLYIAGGAAFPSSGCANPTMTIVALSIRLAGHLRARHEARVPQISPNPR